MGRADVPVGIRNRVVQIAVKGSTFQTIVRVATEIRKGALTNPICYSVVDPVVDPVVHSLVRGKQSFPLFTPASRG